MSGAEPAAGVLTLGKRSRRSEGRYGASNGHARCGSCGRMFAAVGLFDAHRSQRGERGACLDPAELDGLVYREGMWRGREMDAALKAERFGQR